METNNNMWQWMKHRNISDGNGFWCRFVVTSVFQAALRKDIYLWQPVSIEAQLIQQDYEMIEWLFTPKNLQPDSGSMVNNISSQFHNKEILLTVTLRWLRGYQLYPMERIIVITETLGSWFFLIIHSKMRISCLRFKVQSACCLQNQQWTNSRYTICAESNRVFL